MARHPEGPFVVTPFDHRQHARFAWSVLRESPGRAGEEAVADEIRDFAAVAAPGRYHDTLTRFWLALVQHTIEHARCPNDFGQLLADFPILTDKTAPLRHWSAVALWSERARAAWLDPDLVPLP